VAQHDVSEILGIPIENIQVDAVTSGVIIVFKIYATETKSASELGEIFEEIATNPNDNQLEQRGYQVISIHIEDPFGTIFSYTL
jgi:hypothetical protein